MSRYKLISCKLLYRELSYLSFGMENILDTTYLRQGYHNTPELLNSMLQQEIDKLDNNSDQYSYSEEDQQNFDAILIGYGLCSNAVVGLNSKRHTIVIPKAHDCATLLLGSRSAYQSYFDAYSGGIYWYSSGWIENSLMPSLKRVERLREHYVDKYGEDNADYLMEMEQDWLHKYKVCTMVEWDGLTLSAHTQYTRECADYLGWKFERLKGDSGLLSRFVNGQWSEDEFLVLPAGQSVSLSYDEQIICASGV